MVRIYKVQRVDQESKAYCAENRGYQVRILVMWCVLQVDSTSSISPGVFCRRSHVVLARVPYCAQAWLAGTPLLSAYPPKLKKVLEQRHDFEQFEDFNAKVRHSHASRLLSSRSWHDCSGARLCFLCL